MGFWGYRRANGACGVRNHVAVISSVVCANGVVEAIGRAVPGVKTLTHGEGCGRGPADTILAVRVLGALGRNPNVAAVLVVGLGCEVVKPEFIASAVAATGKPVETISIQQAGGSVKATRRGIEIAQQCVEQAAGQRREMCEWRHLTLGLKCGGSDGLSGLTANPLVGRAADWLVGEGGTVVLTETTEIIGAEKILARRAADPRVGQALVALVDKQHRLVKEMLGPLADQVISPGNMDGGISSIQEKALGGIAKSGSTPLQQVLELGDPPTKAGLVFMDGPGHDVIAMTALAAGGAQMFLFTTGRGTPAGFPLAPVIKIASNSELFAAMGDDLDVNAGRLLEGTSLADAGQSLVELVQSVADGAPVKAEINGSEMFALPTVAPPL